MKKKLLALLSVVSALILLAGCGAEAAAPGAETEDPAASAGVEEQLESLAGGEYGPLKTFVDENLEGASPELAGEMAQALIQASERELEAANAYIYSEDSREIQSAIVEAIPQEMEMSARSVLCAEDKNAMMENLPEGAVRDTLTPWLESGLGLRNAEGTYFFVVDYPEYSAWYGALADDATAAYLELAAGETLEATLVEEYLSVGIDTLAERAIAYETFLAQYPDFPMKDTVRIYFNGTVFKLSFPSYFDNLVDAQGHVVTDLMVAYERLSQREDCPVLQGVAQGMLEFIAAQPDGVVSDGYDMDALSENASAVYRLAQQTADELYGALSRT